MDYFENIIKRLIEQEGFWVRQSVRVNLTKQEKVAIGKHSIPRPEIDIVGYKARSNELRILEVKSFLDSPGVRYAELNELPRRKRTGYPQEDLSYHAASGGVFDPLRNQEFEIPEGRYKLFTCENYRNIVFRRLVSDLKEQGMIADAPVIQFGLVAGNIYAKDEGKLVEYFAQRDWLLYRPSDIAKAISELEKAPYENDPYVIAAKMLVRNRQHVFE